MTGQVVYKVQLPGKSPIEPVAFEWPEGGIEGCQEMVAIIGCSAAHSSINLVSISPSIYLTVDYFYAIN